MSAVGLAPTQVSPDEPKGARNANKARTICHDALFYGITSNSMGKSFNIYLISQLVIFSFNFSTLWKIIYLPLL